ncbi:MAG: hypothetical protein WAM14_01555 [Candidatus Nitrosopolaris sp.]
MEAYNKIVIAEFLEIEELIDEKDEAEKYESFVNSYNYEREHAEIKGMNNGCCMFLSILEHGGRLLSSVKDIR